MNGFDSLARVGKVFVGSDVAVGSPATVRALPSGAIAIYNKNMELLAAGDTPDDSDVIYIALGSGDSDVNGPQLSAPIPANSVRSWSGIAYAAATKKTWFIGYNNVTLDGTISASNLKEYDVMITNLSTPDELNRIDRYYYNSGSAATKKEIAEGIASTIYKRGVKQKTRVTVSLVGNGTGTGTVTVNGVTFDTAGYTGASEYGVKVVAKNDNENFDLGINPNLGWGTTSTVSESDIVYSVGSSTDVATLENDYLGYKGHFNNVWFPFSPTKGAVSGSTYDIYTIEFVTKTDDGITGGVNPQFVHICLPATTSTFDKTEFESILNGWMESAGDGHAAVNL